MVIGITLIIVALIITVAVLVYKHDGTAFGQLTGYSFFDIVLHAKKGQLYKLMTQLDRVPGEHKVLIDVQLPVNNSTYPVDAIFVHESGIYVIDSVHKTGWITGDEHQVEWVQVKHGDKQEPFTNPIMVSHRIIDTLRDLLPDVNEDVYSSVSVFSDACSFQKIETYSPNVEVIKMCELKAWTKQIGGEVLSKEEIDKVYHALEGLMSFTQQPTKQPTKQAATN
ncbi:nuclease-related domain-containing protein [Lysinibacillus sp. LZ02]|uniref:nuclease-related domain-containing protein n=1 Tax=Lysinibacillus sp. LZ02 TaxID=3420668 RepID=UPI003D36C097